MRILSLALKLFVLTTCTLTLCSAAQAIPRTWVASYGNDGNPCTRAQPCITFFAAVAAVDPGGEVNVVDAGEYGTASLINKPLTIDGGNLAKIRLVGANAFAMVISPDQGDTVIIRNLTMTGMDSGGNGILANVGQIVFDNVTIEKFTNRGIFAAGPATNNPVHVEINNCRLLGNLIGIQQEGASFLAMRDSVITGTLHKGQTSFGINIQPPTGFSASTKLENNEISFTNSAIRATSTDLGKGPVDLWVRFNHVFRNIVGANFSNAVQYHSDGSNRLSDNQIPISGGTNAGALAF